MIDENPFNSKLYNHTLPVRNELWESIEKRLPPETEQKRFPFFWFLLFASTIISGALMFGILHKKTTPAINSKQIPSYTSPDLSNNTENTNQTELIANSTTEEASNKDLQNSSTHQQDLNASTLNEESASSSNALNPSSNTKSTRSNTSSAGRNSSSSTKSNLSNNSTSSSSSSSSFHFLPLLLPCYFFSFFYYFKTEKNNFYSSAALSKSVASPQKVKFQMRQWFLIPMQLLQIIQLIYCRQLT
jgi:hypothetical protein